MRQGRPPQRVIALVGVFVVFLAVPAWASHYRGGSIDYTANATHITVSVTQSWIAVLLW
ncbi:hypothetical protein CHLRE_02g142600v5 [Chlamydomonas reinhardtii]|uniref:Uncharacterized protein n=1 Tax=Chlamydomonas reinhardtii TaxID=3055 RepID=A0A2K3E409_CHLRE|nr:uncharacterized protein CHLRE_02g142600v5 [Chlamydomonas reinhardtii]PNW87530.1 hypothetical protein CHLRE_02g142600v5 [Chlamydomonas reinhardtii]